MIKKWFFRSLLVLGTLIAIISSFFYFTDNLKIHLITSHHAARPEWEIPPLSEAEKNHENGILSQTFTYIGEGGQSYVLISADGNYVLKFFKFGRFRPTALVQLLPQISLFSSYKAHHTTKREKKWLAAFKGNKVAYDLHRQESGLIHVQLNSGPSQKIKVIDKWGFRRNFNLEKIPYVLQMKAQTLGTVLENLLHAGKLQEAKDKINQLFNLYLSEYHKGIYDLDYGIMHNIGMINNHLIHLDVGKMVYDENIKNPVFYQFDLVKVAGKVKSWVHKRYPQYSYDINHHMEERLSARLDRKFAFPDTHDFEECKNIFESEIYTQYTQQRKEFLTQHPLYEKVKSQSDPRMLALIEKIEMPPGNAHDQRVNHAALVHLLRQPTKASLDQDSRQLYADLIRWTFLQADIQPQMKDFLFEQGTPVSLELSQIIYETFSKLKANPQFNSVKEDSIIEDQFLQGNLPTQITQVNKTTLIRFGQPLSLPRNYAAWFLSPSFSLEFLYFIQQQPSHLYINLMKRHGIEAPLTKALEKLESQIPGLYTITLDKNSSFYWQKENEPEIIASENFKHSFLQKLMSDDFYWTKKMPLQEWENDLQIILNNVHYYYFNNQTSLFRSERQDFIELAYLAILDKLVEKLVPSSMNITCRQGIDRAPSLIALWMLQKKQFNHHEIAALLLAPPIVIHNRPSHPARIDRFVSAAKKIH